MKRIHVLVEGQTEETFVRNLLQPYFWLLETDLNPVIVVTKRTRSGQTFKGGMTAYKKVRNDIQRLLDDTSAVLVTTMLDYYGLPNDFPGYDSLPDGTGYQRTKYLTEKFKEEINNQRFAPFLMLHEFEALLFVSPETIASAFPSLQIIDEFTKIRSGFSSPEEINDGAETHPSARIQKLIQSYQKPLHGSLITQRIGLELLRAECSHFNSWLNQLEIIASGK